MVALIAANRDIQLKLDVERYVRPISFRPGAIEFEPAPGCPSSLAQRLSSRLKDWTGQPWLVAAQGGGGGESLYERDQRAQRETRSEAEAHPFVRAVLDAFPGAEIVGVRTLAVGAGHAGRARGRRGRGGRLTPYIFLFSGAKPSR